jgi:hypothetical protein
MNWEVCSGMGTDEYGLTSAKATRQKSCGEVRARVCVV